jgi:PilZ domain
MARKRSKSADKSAPARGKKKVAPPGSLPEMAPIPTTDPTAHAGQHAGQEATALDVGFISVELSDERGAASGRRQARIPIAARVDVSSIHGVERAQAVSDVSLGGLFVETTHVLEIGDPVMLGFPDSGGKLRVSGRVRWVTPFGGVHDARPGMGIELIGVSDADRMRIFELLRGKR